MSDRHIDVPVDSTPAGDIKTVPRFEPSSDIVRKLREFCLREVGHEWATIAWSPERGCLCQFTTRRGGGQPRVRYELRDENGDPRQADMREVKGLEQTVYGRRETTDKWHARWLAQKAAANAARKAERKEWIHDAVSETRRVAQHGYVSYFHVTKDDGKTKEGFEVIDRRRKFNDGADDSVPLHGTGRK